MPRLAELYPDPNVLFLVVDDESPDGTGRLVREFAAADARVRLLEGKKRGLGAAYVRGICSNSQYGRELAGSSRIRHHSINLN